MTMVQNVVIVVVEGLPRDENVNDFLLLWCGLWLFGTLLVDLVAVVLSGRCANVCWIGVRCGGG